MATNKFFDRQSQIDFGKDYVKILTIMLKREGKDASGALINSINFRIKETAKEINTILIANDYLKYVDEGRKKGSFPPLDAIRTWVDLKGIDRGAVFPIAKKIFEFGIEPTNVIQKTIREIETSPTLLRKYEEDMVKNVEDFVSSEFEKI